MLPTLKQDSEALDSRWISNLDPEEQPWPDGGGPSNTFIPPHAVSGGIRPCLKLEGFGGPWCFWDLGTGA